MLTNNLSPPPKKQQQQRQQQQQQQQQQHRNGICQQKLPKPKTGTHWLVNVSLHPTTWTVLR